MALPALARAQDAPGDDAASAEAPADPVERARALFAEGVEHTGAQRWSEAVRYNLAVALNELGRYREAQAQLDAMDADPETSEQLEGLAADLRERMRAAAGRVSVERSVEVADAAVALDGQPLTEQELRAQILVTPGSHRIEARRQAAVVASTEVSVLAGEHTHVVLGLAGAAGDPPSETPPGEDAPVHEQWYFWAGIGGAAVLIAVVVAVSVVVATADSGGMVVEGNFSPGIITWP